MAPSIGFDFDECIVHAYTFVPFVILFEILLPKAIKQPNYTKSVKFFIEKARIAFYNNIADNEIKTNGTLFRPSFLKLIPRLIKLRNAGKINKLFIYSNNGYLNVINIIDYILGLILQKAPYNINENELIKENDGVHVLSPRIYLDDPKRAQVEPKDIAGFREKSLQGIQACVDGINADELWFLDDKSYHTSLMNSIKERYITVEEYTVKLSNRKLAELFIESFPLEFFLQGSSVATVLIQEINRLMPGFRPTAKATKQGLIDKLMIVLNKFSPGGAGRAMLNWKDDHVDTDLKKIEAKLPNIFISSQSLSSNYQLQQGDIAPVAPVGGGRHRGVLPVSSLLRKTRKVRKDKRKRE
jgi:hypothetical protein